MRPPCLCRPLWDVSGQLPGRPLYGAPLVVECLAERRARHTLGGRHTRRRPHMALVYSCTHLPPPPRRAAWTPTELPRHAAWTLT